MIPMDVYMNWNLAEMQKKNSLGLIKDGGNDKIMITSSLLIKK